jgi:hypothetical protein
MEFKCFIESDDGSFSREVFPYDIQDLGRETKREEGKIYYRFSPNKSITLIDYPKEGIDDASWALDFAKGNDLDRSTKLYFKIIRTSDGIEWLKTSFRFYDLEFETDEDHYVKAIFKPDMEDEYTIFENNKDKEFDIIGRSTGSEVGVNYYSDIEFILTQSSTPPDSTYKLFLTVVYLVPLIGSQQERYIHAREFITIPRNEFISGWTDISDYKNEMHIWTRHWDIGFSDIRDYFVIRQLGILSETVLDYYNNLTILDQNRQYITLCDFTGNMGPVYSGEAVYFYNDYYYNLRTKMTYKYNIGHNLKNSIQRLLTQIDINLEIKSTFLFNDTYPNGTVVSDNYVTHTENILNKLYLIDKLDFKRPNASELTNIANITLSNLNNDLFNLFQVYPFVDENGDYRYEHISYWLNNKELGIDLTQEYSQYLTDRSFKFDKIEIPNREKFSLPEAKSIDFLENEIKYDNVAPLEDGENVKDFTLKKLYTDCDAILTDLENSSNEGFVLVILDEDNNIKISEGLLSGEQVQNAELSFANLLPKYWIHDRPFYKGYINEVLTDFIMKYIKRGNPLKIMSSEDINPKKLVKTYIGDGIVDKLTEYLNDDKDIELLYKI